MARKKIPFVLLPLALLLLAGALVLLFRGPRLTLERILRQQGCTITAQEELILTLTLSRAQMPEGIPERVPRSEAQDGLALRLMQEGDTALCLDSFSYGEDGSSDLYAVFRLEHTLSREGGSLLLPYRVGTDGSVTTGLQLDPLSIQADGEAKPDAVTLVSEGPGDRFDLRIDRALFLRSDAITLQLGPFYVLTYSPA